MTPGASQARRWTARIGVPVALLVAAVVALLLGAEIVAGVLAAAALGAFVADRMIRLGAVSQVDRDRERTARRTLREEGHWPGEPPPEDAGSAPPPVEDPTPRRD